MRSAIALRTFTGACAAAALAAGCVGSRLERQHDWVEMHPEAPRQIKQVVLGKKLLEGMTKDAVRASWGNPHDSIDLGSGDARWTYNRRQVVSGAHFTVEYTLVFSRGVLIRVHQQSYR